MIFKLIHVKRVPGGCLETNSVFKDSNYKAQSLGCLMNCLVVRLLHSLIVVALGLSVEYETWPPIGWHHPFVISWSKYRLGLHNSQWLWVHMTGGNFHCFFRGHWQSPCTALMAGKLPAIRVVQGDCDRVYLAMNTWHSFQGQSSS